MSLLEQQHFTARLFLDESLRRNFEGNAEKIGAENGLNAEEIDIIQQTLTQGFEFFADSLFYKRLNEVEKLLPLTQKALGKRDFAQLFREFSQTFTPQSIKKHLEDAIEFVKFLSKKNLEESWINDLARFEQMRLDFNGNERFFVCRRFNYRLEKLLQNVPDKPEMKKTLLLWFRLRKRTFHFHW